MPSPVTPGQFSNVVPSASASLCDKIKAVLLEMPALLRDLVDWMLNDDGSLSDEFKAEATSDLYQAGDLKWSAVATLTTGWLVCNGQAVSRTTYAALFAAIGTAYGDGDASTTFNVPDARGKFALMNDGTHALASTGGVSDVTLDATNMPAHVHQVAYGITSQGAGADINNDVPIGSGHDQGRTDTTSTGAATPASFSVLNPYVAFNLLIKT